MLFWLEIALLVIIPVILLNQQKVRQNPQYLYGTCAVVVMGFITNRLNVSITALQASSGIYYVPKWTEFAASLATITAAAVAFHYAIVYLDILPKNPPPQKWMASNVPARARSVRRCGREPRENQPGVFISRGNQQLHGGGTIAHRTDTLPNKNGAGIYRRHEAREMRSGEFAKIRSNYLLSATGLAPKSRRLLTAVRAARAAGILAAAAP